MKTIQRLALATALSCVALASHAADAYVGAGFPGYTLGFTGELGSSVTARGEFAGGISLSRDGKREGLTYTGDLKTSRGGAFLDWYPFAGSFRLVGGLTSNDYKIVLNGSGSTGTINGKPVNLTGETFKVTVKYKPTTPYLGLGWGHQPGATGLGFFFDVGVQFGQFSTSAETTVVGKSGITQADVDTEVNKVKDDVAKVTALPSVALGLTYRF
jgi:hypothetical protein